jgi:chloramphenicol 3-O-phosphotransferase
MPALSLKTAYYCEGDIRAQFVWHASCCDEQLLRHDWLAVVVLLGSGVPVAADELIGAGGGTTQVV